MDWIQRNFKTIIYISFLIPILLVALVSISHVTTWYGLTNPISWAIYLSVGIEIAALAALAAISVQMGSKVYLPFGIVTLIQFIGNIFFAYQYIDINSEQFRDWVDLVDPVVSYLGVESGNVTSHKRFLALFSGGMLPIISLSFLHMLVKFEEEDKKNKKGEFEVELDEFTKKTVDGVTDDIVQKYTPTDEELKRLEEELIRINELKFGKLSEDDVLLEVKPNEEILEEPRTEDDVLLEVKPNEEILEEPRTEDDVLLEVKPNEEILEEPRTEENVLEEPRTEENVLVEPQTEENVLVEPQTEENVLENPNEVENINQNNVLIGGVNDEIIVDESITDIKVEPDFYSEEEPDYSLEDENRTQKNIKRLNYFRSR